MDSGVIWIDADALLALAELYKQNGYGQGLLREPEASP